MMTYTRPVSGSDRTAGGTVISKRSPDDAEADLDRWARAGVERTDSRTSRSAACRMAKAFERRPNMRLSAGVRAGFASFKDAPNEPKPGLLSPRTATQKGRESFDPRPCAWQNQHASFAA